MAQPAQDGKISDLQDHTERLIIYNGEKGSLQTGEKKSNSLHYEVKPVDEMVENIAEAAKIAHQNDENEEEEEEEEEEAVDEISTLQALEHVDIPIKTRKIPSRNKKPASKRGVDKPTGFEEYHADAPITPAEYKDEQQMYQKDIPFIDRILRAIQRFEKHRKLDPQRRDVFYKWLSYGGVVVGPNIFSSGLKKGEYDIGQLDAATTQTSLAGDKRDIGTSKSKYVIDFEGLFYYGFETKPQVEMVTNILRRFMDYLLQHEVCPEHNSDILAARSVCKTATAELWACAEAQRWLPGDFNVACSTLFGGSYAQLQYNGINSWDPDNASQLSFVGFTQEVAMQIASLAVTTVAQEEVYQTYLAMTQDNSFVVIETGKDAGFEITNIEPVTSATRDFYKKKAADLRPVGLVHAKAWKRPDSPPEDLTAEEQPQLSAPFSTYCNQGTYTFFVEGVILPRIFVGMKIEATIRRLNCGIWFFDAFMRAYRSFDSWLCNELMVGWKEPMPIKGAVAYESDELGRLEPEVVENDENRDDMANIAEVGKLTEQER